VTAPRGQRPTLADLTVLVVNFRTLRETRACVQTLRQAYPTVSLVVVDNGSADESTDFLRGLADRDPAVNVLLNRANVYHGPALHQGMTAISTDFVFLLDSDVEILDSGFLEPLLQRFEEDPLLYAIGKRGWTNRYGHPPVDRRQPHTAYVHPFACMIDRRKYLTLPPFEHHGAPLWRNMWGAQRAGFHLEHVPIEDHVLHHGAVTANAHGYGLDRRLRAQAAMNNWEWRARRVAAWLSGRSLEQPELPPERSGGPA
jgi:glycosyltransferase involved in cell wall biosynthesis